MLNDPQFSFPSVTLSLSFSAFLYKVFISCVPFPRITVQLCFLLACRSNQRSTITHSVLANWLARFSVIQLTSASRSVSNSSMHPCIQTVIHPSICSSQPVHLFCCMVAGLKVLWVQLNCAIVRKCEADWRPSASFSVSRSFSLYWRAIFLELHLLLLCSHPILFLLYLVGLSGALTSKWPIQPVTAVSI